MWMDIDELVRILSAGVNVVSTAAFITGHNLGPDRDRIVEACERGGSTMFGTGISPGFAELLAIVAATICDRVDKVTVNEAADTTFYDSPDDRATGGLRRADRPPRPAGDDRRRARPCSARPCGWSPTRSASSSTTCAARPSTRRPPPTSTSGRGPSPAGCVAGVAASWKGFVGDKVVVELNVRWRKGQTLEPDWKIEQDGWVIQIDGRPTVTLNVGFLPPPDFEAETIADFMVLGHIMTAARRSTRSPPSSPRHPASRPTTICRWCCRAGSRRRDSARYSNRSGCSRVIIA